MYPVLTSDAPGRRASVDSAVRQARNERNGFLRYFGFRESPFGVTPDPAFLFFSRMHRAALDTMIHSIESSLGFTVLLGGPGTGKTTLLFQLLTQYRDAARTAFVFQTQCKPLDLLRYVAAEFELPGTSRDKISLHRRLEEMLIDEAHAGRKVLIIIDEAQNLDYSSLEAIRLLSDFETASSKLLHVVLAGSPRLGETLLAPQLSPLAQRVFTVCRLEPLTREEVKAYVNFRLKAAGYAVLESLFSQESLTEIAEHSSGVPRIINSICYRSLALAYATGGRYISRALVQQAVRELDLSESRRMSVGMPTHLPKSANENGCRDLKNTGSGDQNTSPDLYNSRLGTPQTESALQTESQLPLADAVTNRAGEQQQLAARNNQEVSNVEQEQHRIAAGAGFHHPSAKRIKVLRPVGFGHSKFNDSSSILMGALILLALGTWSAWRELRPKSSTPQYATSLQSKVLPSENKDGNAHVSPGLLANLPTGLEESSRGKADHELTGAAAPRAAAPVIEALPDSLVSSRITRPSSRPGAPTVPNNVATLPENSDPLIQPLANVPPSVPQLNRPAVTSKPTHVAPASFLHPTKVVQPEYPTVAKLRHIEGDVVLELEIDANGKVEKVRTVSGHAMLREAAEDAAWQWHYPPVPNNQTSVPAVTQVRFNFRLDPEAKR